MTLENGDLPSNIADREPDVREQLATILQRLDDVQRELDMRNRRLDEFRELQDDLAVVAKDVFQTAVVELDEVAPFIQTGDFVALLKRLLRNVNRISEALIAMESAADFVADAQPITHDFFHRFILHLDQLERKGYFRLAEECQKTFDALADTLVKTDLLPAVRQGLKSVREMDAAQFDRYWLWQLYRDTRKPEVRRLLGVTMALIRAVSGALPVTQDPTT